MWTKCGTPNKYFLNFFLCNSVDTQGLKATSRCGLQSTFSQGPLPPTPGAKTGGHPWLGYHQSEAWLVEQKALHVHVTSPTLRSNHGILLTDKSLTTGTRTHPLLIKHQSLNPVLLTFWTWHATKDIDEIDIDKNDIDKIGRRQHELDNSVGRAPNGN